MVKRALVTGGCGFIGSHIVDELLRRGIETYVLDNLSTGKIDNISQHFDNSLFHFIQGDISEVSQIFRGREGFEVVFHEAAIASVTLSVPVPILIGWPTTLSESMANMFAFTTSFMFTKSLI